MDGGITTQADRSFYGVVRLDASDWVIECEPHVSSRLKRVFPRAPQHASRAIRLSASPENSRELRWFLERYPMRVANQRELDDLADRHVECEVRRVGRDS